MSLQTVPSRPPALHTPPVRAPGVAGGTDAVLALDPLHGRSVHAPHPGENRPHRAPRGRLERPIAAICSPSLQVQSLRPARRLQEQPGGDA
eukprot:536885-Pyramimonas_sp.AAC.1